MSAGIRELAWALAGNAVIGFGAGTATLAAFAGSLPVIEASSAPVRVAIISVGFAFFFAGYRLSQAGTYRDTDRPLHVAFMPAPLASGGGDGNGTDAGNGGGGRNEPTDVGEGGEVDGFLLLRGVFVVLGVVGLGTGMRLFALTIQSWSGTLGLVTGTVCILGYIFGHIGMNEVII